MKNYELIAKLLELPAGIEIEMNISYDSGHATLIAPVDYIVLNNKIIFKSTTTD